MQLKTPDFKVCFGGMNRYTSKSIHAPNFAYRILPNFKPNELNPKKIGDKGRWESGWNENLISFRNNRKERDLIPKYYHPDRVLRYKDYYIQGEYSNMEYNLLKVFRNYIFSFLKDYDRIYEFGCGTGFNLLNLARRYPKKELHGLDWAESSMSLIEEINKTYKTDIQGHLFDMFNPPNLEILGESAVFTWGALEQLGTKFEPFLNYLLSKKLFVINIEPLIELYNPLNQMDNYSIQYMKKRGYLQGYLTRLKELEKDGKIEIEKIQRLHFGNMNYEGWSYVMWGAK